MRRITDSLLKSIVRQSLNESYGLLNEDLQEVTPYDITTKSKHGTVPKGAIVTGMTYEPCPEGGICFEYLENAKIYKDSKSAKELINIYCGKTYMGKPTKSGSALSNVTQNLFGELLEFGMNTESINSGLENLGDFPTFCAANAKFKKLNGGKYTLGMVWTSALSLGGDYGIENAKTGARNQFYTTIENLFENSIAVSDSNEYYGVWKKQLEEKYKITKDAADKKKKDAEDKNKNDADLKVKLTGGGSWDDQGWITKHPALGKNETITTNEGNSSVYSLLTNNPAIDKYLYGIMVKKDDATIQPVKFLKTDKTLPLLIDATTEQWVKWSISQSDIWKYDDVIVIDGNIALTTDPEREKKFTTNESYKRKGFRHNLLTEADLTIGSKGAEVESIQKKLGVLPVTKVFDEKTKAAVIEFQTNMGILPATGIVDNKTLTKINSMVTVTPTNSFKSLSIANKSKGDDVKLIQQKLGIPVDGGFGTDTETAVIDFQTKYRNDLPNAVAGVVDIDTFNLIKRYMVNDAGINKVYSGVKTTYTKNDWIYVNPKLGSEGDYLAEKKYFKIKSITEDRYTVVLDSTTTETFDVSNVGGITAKILFGRDAGTGSQTGPNNTNDSGNKEKGKRNKVDNSGRRTNSGTNTVDTEKQRKRELRLNETCNTLREIKQYLNNTKGLSMVVNCKWNKEIRNQVMMALTGGTPVPVEQPANNVVTSVPVTDRLF